MTSEGSAILDITSERIRQMLQIEPSMEDYLKWSMTCNGRRPGSQTIQVVAAEAIPPVLQPNHHHDQNRRLVMDEQVLSSSVHNIFLN